MACYRYESSPNPSKRCKCLSSTLKDAFANCHGLCCKFSTSRLETEEEEEEEEALTSDYDEDEEFVSAVISKYLESKLRQKMSLTSSENFCCDFSPAAGDLFIPAKAIMQQKLGNNGEEREEFVSVDSHFSHCSSSTSGSMEAFVSAKTSFSRCSSLSRIDFPDSWRRRSNILQFSQCEGWPFGLCRRALLLPPPPKSPSDSWKWRKTAGFIKLH